MLIVLGIFGVLAGFSFASFSGLQNTIKMNEYTANIEQDIRSVQRASMLLERKTNEKWLYGLGIDFTNLGNSGKYHVFKWCSSFDNYGDIKTTSILPNYNPNIVGGIGTITSNREQNAYLPIPTDDTYMESSCDPNSITSTLRTLSGYDTSIDTPESIITVTTIDGITPGYVLFESVSGKAFFYGVNGQPLNYNTDGSLTDSPKDLKITITPTSQGSESHIITISYLSGKINSTIAK